MRRLLIVTLLSLTGMMVLAPSQAMAAEFSTPGHQQLDQHKHAKHQKGAKKAKGAGGKHKHKHHKHGKKA